MNIGIEDTDRDARRAVAEQAAAWDARLRLPTCTDAERAAFAAWRDADPEHQRIFQRIQLLVTGLRGERNSAQLRSLRDAERASANRRQRYFGGAIAAGLTALAVGTLLWINRAPAISYATGIGQRSSVTLADGSSLELNSRTRVKVAFSDARRVVNLLEGQAFFHVAKDAKRPFQVHAGGRDIVALGTSFDVNLDQSAVRVTLVEGKVSVSSDAKTTTPVVLTPGQQLVAMRSGSDSLHQQPRKTAELVQQIDTTKVTGWRDGQIFLQDLTLADAVDEMNRHSAVRVEVLDPKLRALKVHGMFRAGEQAAFVTAVESYFPVTVEFHGDSRILIKPKD